MTAKTRTLQEQAVLRVTGATVHWWSLSMLRFHSDLGRAELLEVVANLASEGILEINEQYRVRRLR